MKQHTIETILGFVIITITASFLYLIFNTQGVVDEKDGYHITARFQNAEGIVKGSDVMLAGIKIGHVDQLILDPVTFAAVLTLSVDNRVKLPNDSGAAVNTSGFLGSKFIAIDPGGSDENYKENDQVKYTHSSVNIEALVGKLMHSMGSK